MVSKLLATVVFGLVVIPTALVAAFWTLMGSVVLLGALSGDRSLSQGNAPLVALMLVAGWLGIVALWKLAMHFMLEGTRPTNWIKLVAGLCCGAAVAIALIVSTAGSIAFRLAFIGWPVVGAGILALVLWRSRDAT